jgi:hypothetical protein
MLRILLLGIGVLSVVPLSSPSAIADPPDWGTPTADPAVIRERNKQYELQRSYGKLKALPEWKTAFAGAQKSADLEAMKYLLELNASRKLGFEINAPFDDAGNTPLHLVAQDQGVEFAQLLFKYGALPNVKNAAGDTPLLIAIRRRNNPVAQELISDGRTDLVVENAQGESPLGAAVLKQNDKVMISIAAKLKPEQILTTRVAGTHLGAAAIKADSLAAYKIYRQVLGDQNSAEFASDLEGALKANSPKLLRALLQKPKFEINISDLRSWFGAAIMVGNYNALMEVVRKYPEAAEWTSAEGESLAHAAASQGSLLGLKLLQGAGVKLGQRNEFAETPMDVALLRKQEWVKDRNADSSAYDGVVAFLKTAGKANKPGPLDRATAPGGDRVRWVLEAIKRGEGPRLIKAYGADWLSKLTSRQDGLGLFHLAVLDNDAKAIKAMMALGLDPTAVRDRAKLSAGDLAQLIGDPQVSAILKSARDPIHFTGPGGESTLWTLADLKDSDHYESDETILRLAKLGKYNGVIGGSYQGEKELLYIGSLRKSGSIIDAALAMPAVTADFDRMARDNSASINVRFEVPFYFDEKETPILSNRLLSRFGAIQEKVRMERPCAEARDSLPAEFLAAQEYADLLFELLWGQAEEANKYLNRPGAPEPNARPSIRPDKWDPANHERNRSFFADNLTVLALPNKRYSPLCAMRTDVLGGEQQSIWKSNSTNYAPLRWVCRSALEDSKFESYDLRVDYGAFKRDLAKALSADQVTRAGAAEIKAFDSGIQVAIADPEGHFVARVKMGLDPAAPANEKTMRKLEYFREMGLDRAESYLRKQHPQCAFPVTGQGISGRGGKPDVGDALKVPAHGEDTRDPAAGLAR